MEGVFVYGSLASRVEVGDLLGVEAVEGVHYSPAVLPGWCRDWHVCTDNTTSTQVAYYRPGTDVRPAIQVLFLNISPSHDAAARVTGFVVPVTSAHLSRLDAREANYDRIAVAPSTPARFEVVWTYVAKARQAATARQAIARGTARIRQAYLDSVETAFAGEPVMAAELKATLAPPPTRIVPLDRRLIVPA
jgi:gamma-glutamylcyclotransferase (GGCT)/AIG2-like uncharacterized protein YtfP